MTLQLSATEKSPHPPIWGIVSCLLFKIFTDILISFLRSKQEKKPSTSDIRHYLFCFLMCKQFSDISDIYRCQNFLYEILYENKRISCVLKKCRMHGNNINFGEYPFAKHSAQMISFKF